MELDRPPAPGADPAPAGTPASPGTVLHEGSPATSRKAFPA
jgi:hypothetical protein